MAFRRRRRIIAIGAGLVCPGGGHFYTGQTRRALMLVGLFVLAMVVLIAGAAGGGPLRFVGLALFTSVILFDLVGAQRRFPRRGD